MRISDWSSDVCSSDLYWNKRARGMGGLLTSGATENLLAMPGTRYFGETILVHEFSHAIFDAMETADPALFAQVQKAYADAMAKHLWDGQYGATTAHEYWAEGRSEEHTSELQSLMRISYAVLCLKTKN